MSSIPWIERVDHTRSWTLRGLPALRPYRSSQGVSIAEGIIHMQIRSSVLIAPTRGLTSAADPAHCRGGDKHEFREFASRAAECWMSSVGTQPRGTGWRSVSVCRGAPRPRRCLSQSVTDASRASVLVKLSRLPRNARIPDSSYVISADIIQGSSGALATEQR